MRVLSSKNVTGLIFVPIYIPHSSSLHVGITLPGKYEHDLAHEPISSIWNPLVLESSVLSSGIFAKKVRICEVRVI